jgi:DNA-binding NarL/FixJ family response regulator
MKPIARSKVFVADDSPIVRERLISLLTELPNVEVVGETGVALDAIDSIRRLKPTAVVLDISMPGGGGMSVLETIKKEDQAPMVIMLTNFANEPYRRRCLQLGADYFFDKSSEFEKVIQVLRRARRARRTPTLA